jgi:hypothetical protein
LSYQLREFGELVPGGSGLVAGDDCPPRQRAILERYAREHGFDFRTRDEFAEFFLYEIWEIGTTSITFSASWDHSKIACAWECGTRRHRDAFLFRISRNTFKPRLRIQSLDSRKAFIRLISSVRGESKRGFHQGYFVDVRTLVSALTDESHSLESACKLYGTPLQKRPAKRHGVITPKYIKYNLDDVEATYQVYMAAMRHFQELEL